MKGSSEEVAELTHTELGRPSGKVPLDAVRALSERAMSDPILGVVFDAIDGYAMVLNADRRVLAANADLLELLGATQGETLEGLRPGEAFDCVNWRRGPDGCGSSVQCGHCGAVAAILAAQISEEPVEGQCTITHKVKAEPGRMRASDFRVRISPLTLGGERVYVLVMHDITTVKWRELQERMFLHDLANMLAGLSGWSEEMAAVPSAEAAIEIVTMTKRLNETLENHRLLLRVEAGQQTLCPVVIDFSGIASTLRTWFVGHECARQRSFDIRCCGEQGTLETDQQLLLRVLGNLIKNAFEATPPDTVVTLLISTEVNAAGTRTLFEVHNPGVIAESAAQKLFHGRFSTKGRERGLGLHAVQVLGEHCLGGAVDFTSTIERGTTFRFALPNRVPVLSQ